MAQSEDILLEPGLTMRLHVPLGTVATLIRLTDLPSAAPNLGAWRLDGQGEGEWQAEGETLCPWEVGPFPGPTRWRVATTAGEAPTYTLQVRSVIEPDGTRVERYWGGRDPERVA